MSERLIDLLLRLAPRERLLLALLGLVVVPGALWLVWLSPLSETRLAAESALTDARALNLWVQERAADQALLERSGVTGPRAPIGTSALEQSLIAAGLRDRVTELSNQTGGVIRLRFDAVAFQTLMAWLGQSDPDWGYDITALRIERSDESGIVLAELTLAPQG